MITKHITNKELQYLEREIDAYYYKKWYYSNLWWSDSEEDECYNGEEDITYLFFMD